MLRFYALILLSHFISCTPVFATTEQCIVEGAPQLSSSPSEEEIARAKHSIEASCSDENQRLESKNRLVKRISAATDQLNGVDSKKAINALYAKVDDLVAQMAKIMSKLKIIPKEISVKNSRQWRIINNKVYEVGQKVELMATTWSERFNLLPKQAVDELRAMQSRSELESRTRSQIKSYLENIPGYYYGEGEPPQKKLEYLKSAFEKLTTAYSQALDAYTNSLTSPMIASIKASIEKYQRRLDVIRYILIIEKNVVLPTELRLEAINGLCHSPREKAMRAKIYLEKAIEAVPEGAKSQVENKFSKRIRLMENYIDKYKNCDYAKHLQFLVGANAAYIDKFSKSYSGCLNRYPEVAQDLTQIKQSNDQIKVEKDKHPDASVFLQSRSESNWFALQLIKSTCERDQE